MSDAVVRTVGKKLRYYFEVKRLEDGFDLSGVDRPVLDHPKLKPRKTLQCDVLTDVQLKHHFRSPSIRVKLTQFPGYKAPETGRERRIKKLLEGYITKSDFTTVTIRTGRYGKPQYMSNYSYVQTSKGRKLRSDASCALRSGRKRPLSGKCPVIRSVHPHFVTKKQASRFVTVASKLLVANENIEDLKDSKLQNGSGNKPQSAPAPFETERQLPHINDSRPKTSRGFNGNNKYSEEGRDSAYTTDRNSPGSDEYDRKKNQRPLSARSSDSDYDRSPHPPINERPPGRRRPPSARTLHQNQVMDISHPPGGQVGVEFGIQTRGSAVAIQTDNRDDLQEIELEKGEYRVKTGPPVDYNIYVRTGKRIGASTKADVKLTLFGEHGRSQEFLLAESKRHKIKFQKGHEDLFTIHSPHVGPLKYVKIGHDRPDLMYAWFLEDVTVEDTNDRRVYECPCERWLSGQDGDKRTYRILPVDRDRALIEDSDDDSSDVSYIKEYGHNSQSDREDGVGNSPDSVRARRSQRSSESSYTETETETDSDSTLSDSTTKAIHIPVKPPPMDVKVTQTRPSKSKPVNEKNYFEEKKADVSPGRRMKDDFFDQRPAGPVYTFRTGTSVGSHEGGDTQKPEFSDTESNTSRTYTSDNTEPNVAAVLLPNSPFPVIAEENSNRQSPTHEASVMLPPSKAVVKTMTSGSSQRVVPLIAVEEAGEPTQAPDHDQNHPPRSGIEPQNRIEAVNAPAIESSRSGSTTDRTNATDSNTTTTDSNTTATMYNTSTDRTASETHPLSPTDRPQQATNILKSNNEPVVSSQSYGRQILMTETTKQLTVTQIERAESSTEDSESDSDSSTDESGSESDSFTEGETSRSEKSSKEKQNAEISEKASVEVLENRKVTIHQAAKSGDLSAVKNFIEHSPETRSQVNEVGWRALHVAAAEGQADIVKWLSSHGDSLEVKTPTGYTAMHLAALYGHVNTIMVLSSHGALVDCITTDKQTPLHLAARSGDVGCVKWLVKNRADVNAVDEFGHKAYDLAVENEQDDVIEYLNSYDEGKILRSSSSNLIDSEEKKTENNSQEMTRQERENVEQEVGESSGKIVEKKTPEVTRPSIHEAAKRGNLDRIREILQQQPDQKSCVNEVGWTALHIASSEGQLQVVHLLSEFRDLLEIETPTGYTAMHLAALHGRLHTLMELSSFGAKMNSCSSDGQTPLHLAAMGGDLSCVKWLVEKGSTLLASDGFGRTALDLATENEHDDVVEFLKVCNQDGITEALSRKTSQTQPTKTEQLEDSRKTETSTAHDADDQTDDTPEPDTPGRSEEDLQERRKLYNEQQHKMEESGVSFLDSIRQELD